MDISSLILDLSELYLINVKIKKDPVIKQKHKKSNRILDGPEYEPAELDKDQAPEPLYTTNIRCINLLTEKEKAITTLLQEIDKKTQELKSIKTEYQSLEEKIIEKIVDDIRSNIHDELTHNEFQTVIIDETRDLLDNFRDIKTSFSTSVIRILKSAVDRKKINANLSKDDLENIIVKLEDLNKGKKTRNETENKKREVVQHDIDTLTENLSSLWEEFKTPENISKLKEELNIYKTRLAELSKQQESRDNELDNKRKINELLMTRSAKAKANIPNDNETKIKEYANRLNQLSTLVSTLNTLDKSIPTRTNTDVLNKNTS